MADAVASFLSDIGAWADPGQVAPLLAPGLRPATAERLLASPRTGVRASHWLVARLGHGDPSALSEADLAMAVADPAILESVVLCAGAVWHASRVRAMVLGSDIAVLRARLGEEARGAALRHAALAPAAAAEPAGDAEALADDIARDGAACLAAWIAALPDWAAARVRLKWPRVAHPPADEDARAVAVRIIRELAAEVPA